MKKAFKLVVMTLILALCCGNIMVSAATTEDKSSYETPIKQFIEDFGCYEWEALIRMDYDYSEVAFDFNQNWMTEVASLCLPFVEGELVHTEDLGYGWIDYYKISPKKLKKQGLNFFGKKLVVDDLRWGANDGYMEDAYTSDEFGPVVRFENYETETGIYERAFSVKKKGKTYTATKKVFFGYWGQGEAGEKANYQITYTFKKSTKSDYGFILTGMRIKRL